MATVSGFVEKIKYRNEENGYSVLSVASEGEEYILVGTFASVEEGEYLSASGVMKLHPVYGEQLSVESYEIRIPEDRESILRYLSSGAVKGVGKTLAKRIVKKFKNDTLRILEEEPERLAEVKGISERIAAEIGAQIEEKQEQRKAVLFLTRYGISMQLSVRLYRQYGEGIYSIIRDNPYQLADDVTGIGFKIADEIAAKAGILADSDFRVRSAVLYCLNQAASQGNVCLPLAELRERAEQLLGIGDCRLETILPDLQMDRRVVVKRDMAYLASLYYTELNTAAMLRDLDLRLREEGGETDAAIREIEKEEGIQLDELQKQAVAAAMCSGLLLVTGGPGTGKTTTINAIIRCFEKQDAEILLAAPTGRAAKRMSEATGREAKTIHRLLEITGAPEEQKADGAGKAGEWKSGDWNGMHFEKNELSPLEADCVIIDEMSMVDLKLMCALLKAVTPGTHLVLVGDANQLPSVGAGNVLKDMIAADCFPMVQLKRIYRQAAESDIVVNAHKMIDEEQIDLSKRSRDFLFIRQDSPEGITRAMLTLVREKLPKYVGAKPMELQILTPTRKGPLGVEALNRALQEVMNPPGQDRDERELAGILFRTGDKVMQIKNDYERGVYNGDIGVLRNINRFAETLTVVFDGRPVEYSYGDAEELELAYAVTIHKSQGSEYPAVVIPMWPGPRLLQTRNLIYTAVTRARRCVVLVGRPETFFEMVGNTRELQRYTGLTDRLKELCG